MCIQIVAKKGRPGTNQVNTGEAPSDATTGSFGLHLKCVINGGSLVSSLSVQSGVPSGCGTLRFTYNYIYIYIYI